MSNQPLIKFDEFRLTLIYPRLILNVYSDFRLGMFIYILPIFLSAGSIMQWDGIKGKC